MARTKGAKDKQKRKRRNLLAYGALASAPGAGLGYLLRDKSEDSIPSNKERLALLKKQGITNPEVLKMYEKANTPSIKTSTKILKSGITKGALIGLGGGLAYGALQDKENRDNTKKALKYAAIGAIPGAALGFIPQDAIAAPVEGLMGLPSKIAAKRMLKESSKRTKPRGVPNPSSKFLDDEYTPSVIRQDMTRDEVAKLMREVGVTNPDFYKNLEKSKPSNIKKTIPLAQKIARSGKTKGALVGALAGLGYGALRNSKDKGEARRTKDYAGAGLKYGALTGAGLGLAGGAYGGYKLHRDLMAPGQVEAVTGKLAKVLNTSRRSKALATLAGATLGAGGGALLGSAAGALGGLGYAGVRKAEGLLHRKKKK
jgi:hypothetical protein